MAGKKWQPEDLEKLSRLRDMSNDKLAVMFGRSKKAIEAQICNMRKAERVTPITLDEAFAQMER